MTTEQIIEKLNNHKALHNKQYELMRQMQIWQDRIRCGCVEEWLGLNLIKNLELAYNGIQLELDADPL